jgi:transposase|tara:strand:+ start:2205 stop:3233 length:1029 start_codon:yes stop_codon:yes gene_type:complete
MKSNLENQQFVYSRLTKGNRYSQQWPEYNEAQTKEKLMFYKLINELLNLVPTRIYTFGRPRKSLRDMIFCCIIKTYLNTSARRTISDLELAKRAGYIKEVPHFNTLLNYFDDTGMNIVIKYLIGISSLPLRNVEERFAIDSTGFGTGRFDRWLNIRTQKDSKKKGWRKCHAICGVKTNIITSVEITEGKAGDSPMFSPLLTDTAQNFNVKEVSADKAYSSRENLNLAKKIGAMPYIPFKKNITKGKSKGSPMWATMFELFTKDYIKFAEHYHKRSNIETCFAMIKRKFGDFVRCKAEKSQENEILCKVLTHNLVVLIHEIFELKLEVDFNDIAKKHPAQKVI